MQHAREARAGLARDLAHRPVAHRALAEQAGDLVAADAVDPFDFQFGQQLDLRGDEVTRKEKLQLTIDKSFSASAKLKIPTLAPELSLGAKVSRSMNLEVEQEFPPRVLYRAYTRLGPAPLQTPMWAVERSTTPSATRARAVLE